MPEPPMVDLTDEAPLSPLAPRSPQRPLDPLEPKVWSPSREASPFDPRPAPQSMPRATPQVPPAEPQKERFDLMWPDRAAPPSGETRAEPKVEINLEPKPEAKREPALDMPMPPIPARPRDVKPADKRMPELPRRAERGPAILKSGVIDGMPYTLYADGSIEAQLPQGMVKFASVDALRAHLEKQS
jgi:hypothetical protein